MSTKPKAGQVPDDDFIDVAVLAELAGVPRTRYYELANLGKAPNPRRGVPRAEALQWLNERAEDAAQKAEAARAAAAKAKVVLHE